MGMLKYSIGYVDLRRRKRDDGSMEGVGRDDGSMEGVRGMMDLKRRRDGGSKKWILRGGIMDLDGGSKEEEGMWILSGLGWRGRSRCNNIIGPGMQGRLFL